jgi:tetratricopeptide (TPR) repeat protein
MALSLALRPVDSHARHIRLVQVSEEQWMDTIRMTGGSLGRLLDRDDRSAPQTIHQKIAQVSLWMIILGTVRLVCAIGDYASTFLEASRWSFSWRVIGRFVQENPPALVLGAAWPLALGLILQRTGREMFLKAAAITFFVLSAGGVVTLIAGLTLRADWQIYIGSFHVSLGMLFSSRLAVVARVIIGSVQLLLEFVTAAWAWHLFRQARPVQEAPGGGHSAATPRALLQGRLAVYLSLAFLVLNLRLPIWSAYLEILNRSQQVRQFILENDTRHHISYRDMIVDSPASRLAYELDMLLSSALRSSAYGQYAEALEDYRRIIVKVESSDQESMSDRGRNFHLARALNNLGWLLATCADASVRDPVQALPIARRAVALAPEEGTYWNTLGVTFYRAGQWDEAMKAFDRSMELRGNGDSYDWYFVAMIRARQRLETEAQGWYGKAVAWHEGRAPGEEELYRFRTEAAEVLGLPKPPPPAHVSGSPVSQERRSLPDPFTRWSRSRVNSGAATHPENPTIH